MTTEWSNRTSECAERFSTQRNARLREELVEQVDRTPVLEVGCGTQYLADHIDGEYLGMDITQEFGPDVVGDGRWLPFKTDATPTVVTKNAIQHIDMWKSAIRECHRVASSRVVFMERTTGSDTHRTSHSRLDIYKWRFNPDDFMDALPGSVTHMGSGVDYRLSIFVGGAA